MFNPRYSGNDSHSHDNNKDNHNNDIDDNSNHGISVNENAPPQWSPEFNYDNDTVGPANETDVASVTAAPDAPRSPSTSGSGVLKHRDRNRNGPQVSFKDPPRETDDLNDNSSNNNNSGSTSGGQFSNQKSQSGFTFTNPWNNEPLPPVQHYQSTHDINSTAIGGAPPLGATSSISPLNFLDPNLFTDDYNRRKSILVIPPKRVPNPVPLQSDVYSYAQANYRNALDSQMFSGGGGGYVGSTPIFNQDIFQTQLQQQQQQQQPSQTLLLNKLQQAQQMQTRHFPFIYNVQESQRRQSVAVGVGMGPYGVERRRRVGPYTSNLLPLATIPAASGNEMVSSGPSTAASTATGTATTSSPAMKAANAVASTSNIIVDRDLPGSSLVSPAIGPAALSSSGTPTTISANLAQRALGSTFGGYSMMMRQPPVPPMYRRLSAYPMTGSSLATVSASASASASAATAAAVAATTNVTATGIGHPFKRQFRLGGAAAAGGVGVGRPKEIPVVVPQMHECHSKDDLKPVINKVPKFRRASLNTKAISPLVALTKNLITTYRLCSPDFTYHASRNPRRILTKPSDPVGNNGYDNIDSDYILYVNDVLGTEQNRRYLVLDVLGSGTFGQVVKCQNLNTKKLLAVKVIKSKSEYVNQSLAEINILELLNTKIDPDDTHHFLRMYDSFVHKNHLCLVFELLSKNLYELLKINQFYGLSISLIKIFAKQILESLRVLKSNKLIHCDLKPENILLVEAGKPEIKIIDFGSACEETRTIYTYIQSRFYRSPEVILGIPYTTSIDMWSFGCIVAELFLGIPIFPGSSEFNQLTRIINMLGYPPNWMLEMDKASLKYLKRIDNDDYDDEDEDFDDIDSDTDSYDGCSSVLDHQRNQHRDGHSGRRRYRLKSLEEFNMEFPNAKEEPGRQYFKWDTLEDIIIHYRMPRKIRHSDELIELELEKRECLVHFLNGILDLNPMTRWTPEQALLHPFITDQPFTGEWFPPGQYPVSK